MAECRTHVGTSMKKVKISLYETVACESAGTIQHLTRTLDGGTVPCSPTTKEPEAGGSQGQGLTGLPRKFLFVLDCEDHVSKDKGSQENSHFKYFSVCLWFI